MFHPLSICDAASQIRSGQLQPLELVERCLEQIGKYDDRLHAWVVVDGQGARRAAQQLDRQEPCGPLHGIPLGIKDIIDVEGFPTRAGSPLREDHVARADAPLVAALRRAGAIILGKTVTVEFACFDPSPTRNPWDPDLKHTPGGSSSGSAVAVAMGMCPGAIGTQTGGSLVRPASYCGIAACKPTFGGIDIEGIVPVSYHLDHPGPMAQNVADLEIMLRCLMVGDGFAPPYRRRLNKETDATTDRRRLNEETVAATDRRRLDGDESAPVLGLVEQFFMEEADLPVRQLTESALAKLRHRGARIETATLPEDFAEVLPMHGRIMAVEAAAYHRRQFAACRRSYGPMIASLLDEGLKISGVDYAAGLSHQRAFRRRAGSMLEGVDALIMPATDTTAPATLETTGNNRFQAPWSYAGLPVVSIPSGLASDGMPAAVQLVGRADREAELLQVARWCEQCLAFNQVPLPGQA